MGAKTVLMKLETMLEDTEVLWPENEDYYALMLMRESEGPASFDSEKQNEPVNPADCLFLEEEFHYWDDRWETSAELIAAVGKNACWVGACDPSLGKSGKLADDSAIITLLRDSSTGTLYVIDADILRRKPDLIIESVLTYGCIPLWVAWANLFARAEAVTAHGQALACPCHPHAPRRGVESPSFSGCTPHLPKAAAIHEVRL